MIAATWGWPRRAAYKVRGRSYWLPLQLRYLAGLILICSSNIVADCGAITIHHWRLGASVHEAVQGSRNPSMSTVGWGLACRIAPVKKTEQSIEEYK